jgi:RNA polymerase II-associated factor 1
MSQYYIARIRYQNPLPPPPFPPKLLSIPTPIDPYTTPEYTSILAQQQPPNVDLDIEGGMPLDLTVIPGLFEGDDSGTGQPYLLLRLGLYGDPLIELDPADRMLLKTPETGNNPSRTHSHLAVPFLRRTEYIAAEKHSSMTHSTRNILRGTRRPSLQFAMEQLDHVFEDPLAQNKMIEQMFEEVTKAEAGIPHPRKRGVNCVQTWDVIPDRERVGMPFLLMRFQDNKITGREVRSRGKCVDGRMIRVWK